MSRSLLLLGALAIMGGGSVAAVACGSGVAPTTDDGGGTEAGPMFTYAPAGCQYTVVPGNIGLEPGVSNGFTDVSLDDTSAPTGDITPERVRVGIGGGTDSSNAATYANPRTTAAFTWETATASHAAKVKLGTSPTALMDVHTGYTWTTPQGLGSHTAFMHAVHVCGLTAGTTYYYQVGGGPMGAEVWSATQSFTTVPDVQTAADGGTVPITVGVLGDARDTLSTWQLAEGRMLQLGVAIQLIPGDIVAIGSNGDMWAQWLDGVWHDPSSPSNFYTLGQQLMVPIAGNHEAEAAEFYGNWSLPGDGNYAETYASFDIGNTHFVMVDDQFAQLQTDLTQPPASTVLQWLDGDLNRANQNRGKVPFIVALDHRGLFSTSEHAKDGDVLAARGALAPVFDKYSVDLVLNGHDHEYERSKPLKAGNPPSGDPVVGSGTTYVICAGAGAAPYSINLTPAAYTLKSVCFDCQANAYIGTYLTLTLSSNTLTLTAYGLKASGTDDVIDTLTLSH